MKKILACVFAAVGMLSACASQNTAVAQKTEFCALVKEMKDSVIVVDVVEFITMEDTERVAELELTDLDMPNGYYINNAEIELEEYTVTKETVYNFIDWNNDFVEKGENREFSTTNQEGFQKYLNTYTDAQPKMPFFFEVMDGEVVSIIEKPMM